LYQGTPGEYLVAIAAHETAHQWWYGRVGNDQALEPWLDEALCTYSELIYYENLYPESVQWWWSYRVDYYAPSGAINISIYNPDGSATPYLTYKNSVYLNGAHFLDDLRKQIGDDIFFVFLKDYAEKMYLQIAGGQQFFDILSNHTSSDISDLINIYFK
jgi:aminopeptidase N